MNDLEFTGFSSHATRIAQQRIIPTAVKSAGLAQTTLGNTTAEIIGPGSLPDGVAFNIKSFLTNSSNKDFRIGAVPYNIVFFEDDLNIGSIIGDGVTGYTINGPFSMPQFTPYATLDPVTGNITLGGNDGNNLVFFTEIINNTGFTHDIYAIVDTRVYNPIGGAVT